MQQTIADLLVGSTGFVGSNLLASHAFSQAVHSTDVASAYGSRPGICVYAGVPSEMFTANADPEADLAVVRAAHENLRRIAPKCVVLVSTIAVYADSRGRDESDEPDSEGLSAYGANRLQLERWVREDFPGALVVRLPALWGAGLRKNFVRDMVTLAPPLLRAERYAELAAGSPLVASSYADRGDGWFAVVPHADRRALRAWFAESDFNALSFTDSRSRYQYYGLGRLWGDIEEALRAGWEALNCATPPVSAGELHRAVLGTSWENELPAAPFDYDMRTLHSPDGSGYLCTLAEEVEGVRAFVGREVAAL